MRYLFTLSVHTGIFGSRIGRKESSWKKATENGTEKGTDRARPVRTFFRTIFTWSSWILMVTLQWACNPPVQYAFEGKWQSLNTPETVIEFTPEKEIILFRNKISLWASATKHGELTIKFTSIQGNWYHFDLLDGDEFFVKGRIETVDENRIRIYFHKHHDILDVADEYYRTDGFDNYQVIMDKILMEK